MDADDEGQEGRRQLSKTLETPVLSAVGKASSSPVSLPPENVNEAPDKMEAEREKHKNRASRFGTDFKEPKKAAVFSRSELVAMRVNREGFATGMDLYTEEELKKRETRAKKYGTQLLGRNPEEIEAQEKKNKRQERFGVIESEPAGAVMDIDLLEERKEVDTEAESRPE
eukprot:gene13761-16264_t